MSGAAAASVFSPSLPQLLLFCLLITGTLGRRYLAHSRNSERPSSRSGGYPKSPVYESTTITPSKTCGLKMSPKIVGGITSTYGDHPWQVEIEKYRGSGFYHLCGGAIISPFHIITAAHCLADFSQNPPKNYYKDYYRIKVGDHNLDQKDVDEQMFEVASWRFHHDFKQGGTYNNDIAVLKVLGHRGNKGIQMSRYVSALCLPSNSTLYTTGAKCQVTGWGFTDPDHISHPRIIRNAEVPLISNEECKELLGGEFGPGMVCAGYSAGKIDACRGDSGGPLACEVDGHHTLLGVVSWGKNGTCGEPKLPGVYSSTQYYLDWIQRAVEEL